MNQIALKIAYLAIFLLMLGTEVDSQDKLAGNGLDIYLLLDCSLSATHVPDNLKQSRSQMIAELVRNLREYSQNGDHIMLYGFADKLLPSRGPLYVGDARSTKSNIQRTITSAMQTGCKEFGTLNSKKTDIAGALESVVSIVAGERGMQNRDGSKARTVVVALLTDGLNDPKNQPGAARQELLESNRILQALGDVGPASGKGDATAVGVFLLPYERLLSEEFLYHHRDAWENLVAKNVLYVDSEKVARPVGPPRFLVAPDHRDNIAPEYRQCFTNMRHLNVTTVLYRTGEFELAPSNGLTGKLYIDVAWLRDMHKPIPIRVSPLRVTAGEDGRILFENRKDAPMLAFYDHIEYDVSTVDTVLIDIRLPDIIRPGVSTIKVSFEVKQLWTEPFANSLMLKFEEDHLMTNKL